MNGYTLKLLTGIGLLLLTGTLWCDQAASQSMSNYAGTPPFVTTAVTPNILLLLDNSGSMNNMAYPTATVAFNNATKYSGIFDGTECYQYASNRFQPDPAANPAGPPAACNATYPWSGNLLNYGVNREIDVVKLVMVGGTCNVARDAQSRCSRVQGQSTFNGGACCHAQAQSVPVGLVTNLMPAAQIPGAGNVFFRLDDNFVGQFCVDDNNGGGTCNNGAGFVETLWNMVVDHPELTSGVIQTVGTKARFALMEFNTSDGGHMLANMGSSVTSIVSGIETTTPATWTPLGESLYEAVRYYAQLTPAYFGTDYTTGVPANDPFYYTAPTWATTSQYVSCCQNYVIIFTDGQPTQDSNIPAGMQDYAHVAAAHGVSDHCAAALGCTGTLPHAAQNTAWHDSHSEHHDNCSTYYGGSTGDPCASNGSHILDDVAFYAHVTDLRPDSGGATPCASPPNLPVLNVAGNCLKGLQNLSIYTFFAFGTGANILKDAAKVGGFIDKDGNGLPTNASEYDVINNLTGAAGADGFPDNYFEAQDAFQLESRLIATIASILHQSSSGTAVSVLATSSTSEGSLYQSYFYTSTIDPTTLGEAKWTGYTQGLFLDPFGNIREDTDGDRKLIYSNDRIVVTRFDNNPASPTYNKTLADLFTDANGDGVADSTTPTVTVDLNQMKGIWEAGKQLALTLSSNRNLITWVDTNNDKLVNGGEQMQFSLANSATLHPYIRGGAAPFTDNGIINFIRGCDPALEAGTCPASEQNALRNRKLTVTPPVGAPVLRVWKFGDPINSTPTVVNSPQERFDLLYGDPTYTAYLQAWSGRRQVVYVGANDGMLHAFNGGYYHKGDDPSTSGVTEHGWYTKNPTDNSSGRELGEEIWGFIPYELLPQLQWLADPSYSHVYFVDLKPRVTDMRIFCDAGAGSTPPSPCITGQAGTSHPNGWGTVLVGGFRMGGSCNACTTTGPTMTVNIGGVNQNFYSAYFVLDITNPEADPKLLWSFSDAGLGLTTGYPTFARMNLSTDPKANQANAKWYIVFGSGMTGYDGSFAQTTKMFAIDVIAGPGGTGNPNVTTLPVGTLNGFMGDLITLDKDLDYRSDAIYGGRTYVGGPPAQGKMYRLTMGTCSSTPCSTSTWGIASGGNRVPTEMLDTFPPSGSTRPGPITAAPTVTLDDNARVWVFFGSGRYYNDPDKTNTEAQYLFGLKDAVLSGSCTQTSQTNCWDNDLVDVSNAVVCTVCTGNQVTGVAGVTSLTGTATTSLQGLVASKDGWFLTLPTAGERSISAPTLVGGSVFFPSFIPVSDMCQASGTSNLYALFYLTGSAYSSPVIGTTAVGAQTIANKVTSLGTGLASQMVTQVTSSQGGCAGGVKGFSQSSTGSVTTVCAKPPLMAWSQYTSWNHRRD